MEEKYGKQGFRVIAVNSWDEEKEVIKKFAEKEKLKHTILLMGSEIADEVYGVIGSPSSYWIDHEGKVLRREEGFSPFHARKLEAEAQKLLARKNKK